MSKPEKKDRDLRVTARSAANYVTDLVEWSFQKNLEVAGDVAKFVVVNMRLSARAENAENYRSEIRGEYESFGDLLKDHYQDVVERVKTIPDEMREVVEPKTTKPRAKKKASPKTKKTAAKVTSAKTAEAA